MFLIVVCDIQSVIPEGHLKKCFLTCATIIQSNAQCAVGRRVRRPVAYGMSREPRPLTASVRFNDAPPNAAHAFIRLSDLIMGSDPVVAGLV